MSSISHYDAPFKKTVLYVIEFLDGRSREVTTVAHAEMREGALILPLPEGKQLIVGPGQWRTLEQK